MIEDDPTTPAPATGTDDPRSAEITPADEPNMTGTVFLTFLLLVVIGGVWVIMYRLLLTR